MTATTNFCVRMDSELKKQCEAEQPKKSKAPTMTEADRQARDSFAKRCSSVEEVLNAIEK